MDMQQKVLSVAAKDGFAWNPYAEDRLNRCAGRAKKHGLLTVWFRASADTVWLRTTDAGIEKLKRL